MQSTRWTVYYLFELRVTITFSSGYHFGSFPLEVYFIWFFSCSPRCLTGTCNRCLYPSVRWSNLATRPRISAWSWSLEMMRLQCRSEQSSILTEPRLGQPTHSRFGYSASHPQIQSGHSSAIDRQLLLLLLHWQLPVGRVRDKHTAS